MAILAAEWQGIISRSWNSERHLVFSHVVLTKTLVVRRAHKIRARITWRMDLWERDQYTGLAGDVEVEGAAERAGPPSAARRRTMPWPGDFMRP